MLKGRHLGKSVNQSHEQEISFPGGILYTSAVYRSQVTLNFTKTDIGCMLKVLQVVYNIMACVSVICIFFYSMKVDS